MRKILLVVGLLLWCGHANAQSVTLPCYQTSTGCIVDSTANPLPVAVYGGTTGYCLTSNGASSAATFQVCGGGGGGSGTVTSVSVVTANGVSGSVATPTTTPAITLTLGAITPTTVNGLTISTSTGTVTIANAKTLTDNNTLTFSGTDGSSVNFGAGGTVLYGNQTITLSGDVTGSGTTAITTTAVKVNGVAYAATPSTDTTPVITASNTATYTALPNCVDTGGNHLNYTTSTHLFSCGTSGSGGGGGTNNLLPSSSYTTDTAGNLFPSVYAGGGGNVSTHDAGWGLVASLAASPVLELRFQVPPSIPSGTFKLVSYCLANATSGVMKYTPSDAIVAAGSSPSAATLTADTQVSQTWASADVYVVNKTTLSGTPTANSVSVVAVTFNASGWTLGVSPVCRWEEIWE